MTPAIRQLRDELLALRCQRGEANAFADLVNEMERPLMYFAAKLLGDRDAALDLLQELWLKAFRSIGRLAEPKQLRPWLYQIARGLAIDRMRKDRADSRRERERAIEPMAGSEEPSFQSEDAEAIHRALDRLDWKHREVLVLHFLEDLPIAAVAEVIDCPEGTVKSRLYHAKRALRAAMEGK